MTSSPPLSPKLFARDLAAYSDAELNRYLEESGRVVEVEDPENLPEDFIQRLRDRAHLPTDKEAPPQEEPYPEGLFATDSSPSTLPPTPDEERYRKDLQGQTEAYYTLVNNGGQPSHPLSLLEDIAKDLGEYCEILSFWQDRDKPEDWKVFMRQLSRWEDFRRLQKFARGQIIVLGQYKTWESFVGRQQHTTGEQGRFPIYVRAVKDRLKKHGFTRTFQLDEDPARQDKLTTWIEYLGYEYWWYDQYALSKR
ncbi:hypothetical protein K469DRAFT_765828 [Zopfia rhizophila CBS 207.26]|uniref:Uncharacterized protein n=1 Tax=Zopfia rhizophila CBS 207.26 TaxID=1314779 RepID=A0A6A6EDH4_9PEZI|nr:hypothetical protein K469DRAFT_765828 [Zopfia rhizophila CBS 207.26]